MEQDLKTLNEIKDQVQALDMKFIRLLNSTRQVVIPWNNGKIDKHWPKIDKAVASSHTPDGVYLIEMRQSHGGKSNFEAFCKGDAGQGLAQAGKVIIREIAAPQNGINVLTWEQALKYEREIADLKSQLKSMELERDHWKKLYDDIPEEEEPTEEESAQIQLGQPSQKPAWAETLETIVPSLMAGWEKQMELQAKKLELMYAQHNGNNLHIQKPAPPKQPQMDPAFLGAVQTFFDSLNDDDYEKVQQLAVSLQGNIVALLNTLPSKFPDIYGRLESYLQGGSQ